MKVLLAFTAIAFLASLVADRRKTVLGMKKGLKMFLAILPTLFGILSIVSMMLAAFHPSTIRQMLGGGGTIPFIAALLIGSISLIPGFIAFPLASVLKSNGATTPVLAAFVTTLMMVGVLTLPLEAKFFGYRIAILRNVLAFIGAIIIALLMSVVLS